MDNPCSNIAQQCVHSKREMFQIDVLDYLGIFMGRICASNDKKSNFYIGALCGVQLLVISEGEGKVKEPRAYEVDLTKIQGDGDFSCPSCGVIISPQDETEDVYCVLETKVKGQALEELLIRCNMCGSKILLVGFLIPEIAGANEFTCSECGVYIDRAEQDKVEGNYYVCGNCFTVVYASKK